MAKTTITTKYRIIWPKRKSKNIRTMRQC